MKTKQKDTQREQEENEEIIKVALEKHHCAEELKPYQAELIKLQHHLGNDRQKNGHSF